MKDIEVSAVIDKSDIAPLGKLKGSSNASPVVIEGIEFGVGGLKFLGFAGACSEGDLKRYCGVFRFCESDGKDHANRKHFDFLKPKASGPVAEKVKPAKAARPAKGETP